MAKPKTILVAAHVDAETLRDLRRIEQEIPECGSRRRSAAIRKAIRLMAKQLGATAQAAVK